MPVIYLNIGKFLVISVRLINFSYGLISKIAVRNPPLCRLEEIAHKQFKTLHMKF